MHLKEQVSLAAEAVLKLAKAATDIPDRMQIASSDDDKIVKATALAFQDVAPLFKTMSTVKTNWNVEDNERVSLSEFESSLTRFFLRLDFHAPIERRHEYIEDVNKFAMDVKHSRELTLDVLRQGWLLRTASVPKITTRT